MPINFDADPPAAVPPTRILIADDVTSARTGLEAFLNLVPGFQVVGQAGDGLEALQQAYMTTPDVLIMDIEMPGMDGLEAARRLRELKLPMRIILLSTALEHRSQALALGVDGFVFKGEPLGHLVTMLETFRPARSVAQENWNEAEYIAPITIIELETGMDWTEFSNGAGS